MLRPIDAYTLNNALVSWYNDTEGETEKSILRRVMQMVVHAPTLTPLNEPLTLNELREMDGEPVWENRKVLEKLCFSRELNVGAESGIASIKVKEYLRQYKEDVSEQKVCLE